MLRVRLAGAAVLAAVLAAGLAAPASGDGYRGTLRNLHADDPRGGRTATAWGLERAGRTRPLYLTEAPTAGEGDAVRVQADPHQGGLVGSVAPARTVLRDQRGAHELLVVLLNFASGPQEPWTQEEVRGAIFTGSGSANAYFREESWDQISLTGRARADGDVTGWYTVAVNPGGGCQISSWSYAADALARADGFEPHDYDHVMYVFPGHPDCWFAGAATVGGGLSWINGTLSTSVTAHELGHNMYLHHAGSLTCTGEDGLPVTLSDSCTLAEYGDRFDVMGAYGARHSHGWHLDKLGVLADENIRTITQSGVYTVRTAFAPTSEPTTLRIPRGGGAGDAYELEIRSPGGVFEAVAATDFTVTGVSLRLNPDPSSIAISQLLDGNPRSNQFFRAAPLQPGTTFDDGTTSISVVSAGDGTATVQVTITPPPDTTAPTVPSGVRAAVATSGVNLEWDAASDDTGVTGYEVTRDGTVLGTTGATSFADGLAGPGVHVYTVAAIDAAGNRSGASAPALVEVPGANDGGATGGESGAGLAIPPPPPPSPALATSTALSPARDATAPRVRLRRLGALRSGRLRVRATASDDVKLARLDLWMDGRRLRRTARGRVEQTVRLAPGRHTIVAVARDAAGHRASARLVAVGPRRR